MLRASQDTEFAPQPGVAEVEQLATDGQTRPCVEVTLSGEFDDLSPAVGAAIYRLAQESITNARRHARHATQVTVAVTGDADRVRLTIDDDGSAAGGRAPAATAWWACGNAPHCSAAPSTQAPPPSGAGG